MDFETFKSAAQFPFPQPQNTFLASNATPLIDFSLKMLATGRVEPKIRISFVTQPLIFPVFNSVLWTKMGDVNLDTTLLNCFSPFPYHFMFNIFFRTSSDLFSFFSENEHGLARFYRFDGFPTFKIKSTIFSGCCLLQCNCTYAFSCMESRQKGCCVITAYHHQICLPPLNIISCNCTRELGNN